MQAVPKGWNSLRAAIIFNREFSVTRHALYAGIWGLFRELSFAVALEGRSIHALGRWRSTATSPYKFDITNAGVTTITARVSFSLWVATCSSCSFHSRRHLFYYHNIIPVSPVGFAQPVRKVRWVFGSVSGEGNMAVGSYCIPRFLRVTSVGDITNTKLYNVLSKNEADFST